MPATDFHQHVWTDEFRRVLERRRTAPLLRKGHLILPRGGGFAVDPDAYAPEARLAELDRAGLDRAVVSLAPTSEPSPDLVEVWHAEALELERASSGRLVPLALGLADRRFAGAVVSAPVLARGGADALLDRLDATGGLAFVHPDAATPAAPGWRTAGVAYVGQMLDAYSWWLAHGSSRWPGLRVVFALLGGGAPFQLERFARRGLAEQAAFRDNVWFETSSYGARALELSLQTFGASRLLFGSDAPVDRVSDALACVRSFGPALELRLLVSNPTDVLGGTEQRCAA